MKQSASTDELHRAIEQTLGQLKPASKARLQNLADMYAANDWKPLRFSEVLQRLFPDVADDKRGERFRSFTRDVRKATPSTLPLNIDVHGSQQAPPTERTCALSVGLPTRVTTATLDAGSGYTEAETSNVEADPVAPRGIRQQPPTVRYFVSHTEDGNRLTKTFLASLDNALSSCSEYRFELWDRTNRVLAGDNAKSAIAQAIDACDFGLLLISNAYLANDDIKATELGAYIANVNDGSRSKDAERRCIPVLFDDVIPSTLSKRLDGRQVYSLKGKSFTALPSTSKRTDFVNGLLQQALAVLARQRTEGDDVNDTIEGDSNTGAEEKHASAVDERIARHMFGHEELHVEPTRGRRTSLQHRPRGLGGVDTPQQQDNALDAVHDLLSWLAQPNVPFYALLGDYGMGKTTTCKLFAREILNRRDAGEDLPLPIYLDLRALDVSEVEKGRTRLTLEFVLQNVVDASMLGGREYAGALNAESLKRAFSLGEAFPIFDGLDEPGVKLTPQQVQQLIREIWRVVQTAHRTVPATHRQPPGENRSKLVISCRSHFFRSIWEQNALLTGNDREGVKSAHYLSLELLPFSEEQIRGYFSSHFGDNACDRLMALCEDVHNLRDMATRPYILSIIRSLIPDLEQARSCGEPINTLKLYDLMTARWLQRDNPKHTINPLHKQVLMESLALAMWNSGVNEWPIERLESWLDELLRSDATLSALYAPNVHDREILKEDFRNATFVRRVQEENFRFAHTSVQEYFLAKMLHRALLNEHFDVWHIATPSVETLKFVCELIDDHDTASCITAWETLLRNYVPKRSELALNLALFAHNGGHASPSLARLDMRGASLGGLHCFSVNGNLNLAGSDFSGAQLTQARFENVNLSNSRFENAQLRRAEFHHVRAPRCHFAAAQLQGGLWRQGSISNGEFRGADLTCAQFLNVRGAETLRASTTHRRLRILSHAGLLSVAGESAQPCRMPIVQVGHASLVLSVAYSPNGQHIVSGSDDNTLRIWDSASGEAVHTLSGHASLVLSVAYSPNGQHIVSGSDDNTLRIWDSASGEAVHTLSGHTHSVLSVAYSPNGQHIVSGSDDNTLRIWDSASGEAVHTLSGHTHSVLSVAYSPNGQHIVSGSSDNTLRIWDSASGEAVHTLSGHASLVLSVAYSPNGQHIVSGSDDNTLRIWDSASGEAVHTLSGHTDSVLSVAYSPNGQHIVSGSSDNTLRIWDSASGEAVHTLSGHTHSVLSVAYSPNGQHIVSGSSDNTLRIWDSASGEAVHTLSGGHASLVLSVAYSPNGQHIVSGSDDNTLRIWDSASGEAVHTLSGHTHSVLSVAYSPNGQHIVSGSDDNTLRIWDSASGEAVHTLSGHTHSVLSVAYSPNGQHIVSGSSDNTLRIWDSASGEAVHTLSGGHASLVLSVAYSPNGQHIVSGSDDNTLRIWDSASGEAVHTLSGHASLVLSVAYSPNGQHIVSGSSDNTLRIWDSASGEAVHTLSGHTHSVLSVAYSPNGQHIVSGSDDNTLRIWDSASGEAVHTLSGHTHSVLSVAYSPNGQHIVSGSYDNTLRIWDSTSGECVFAVCLFENGEFAALDATGLLAASANAWRFLGLAVENESAASLTRLPIEAVYKFDDNGYRKGAATAVT